MFINNFYKISHNKKALNNYCRILVKMATLEFDSLAILLTNDVELIIAVLVVLTTASAKLDVADLY